MLLIYALGASGRLMVRPWPLALLPASIPGVHAQPGRDLGAVGQAVNNFFGPALPGAALLLVALRVRLTVWRAALTGNAVVLAFYAVIELADAVFDQMGVTDPRFMVTPEFNYGVPLGILVVASGWAASRSGPVPLDGRANAGSRFL